MENNNFFGVNFKYYPELDTDHPESVFDFFRVNMDFADYINNHYIRKTRTNEDTCALMRDPSVYAKYLASKNNISKESKDEYIKRSTTLLSKFIENKDFFWLDENDAKFERITALILNDEITCYDVEYMVVHSDYLEYFTAIMKDHVSKKEYVRTIRDKVSAKKRAHEIKKKLDKMLEELLRQLELNK